MKTSCWTSYKFYWNIKDDKKLTPILFITCSTGQMSPLTFTVLHTVTHTRFLIINPIFSNYIALCSQMTDGEKKLTLYKRGNCKKMLEIGKQ